MLMVQDVVVDLILTDLEIPKDFSILQKMDIWITDTSASNHDRAHKKGIMKLRKDESSSCIMGMSDKAVKNRMLEGSLHLRSQHRNHMVLFFYFN